MPAGFRKTLEPGDVTAICDNREQRLLDLSPLKTINGTLTTGDYSVVGLEHEVAIERKSLEDLIGCIGSSRERFDREIQRLLAYGTRAIVVEATWGDLIGGGWRGQIKSSQATGTVLGWIAQGVPILFVGDHAEAGRAVSRILFIAARRRWRQLQEFSDGIMVPVGATLS